MQANMCLLIIMVKILSCNVQGLGAFKKRREFFYYFHEKNIDIIYSQETHSTKACQKVWKSEWGGPIYFSHGTSNARGVAILFSRNLNFQLINTKPDLEGRALEIRIQVEETELTLVNVYAPNDDNPNFFQAVFKSLTQIDPKEIILGGDMNLVLDLELDKDGGRCVTHCNAQRVLKAYMQELNLIDAWRLRHPEDKVFTWRGKRGNEDIRVRLDYFLVSESLLQHISEIEIKPRFNTDHSFPFMDINLVKVKRGKGVWKFNTSLLQHKSFLDQVNSLIEEEINTEYESARHRWEVIKIRSRSAAI